MRRILDVVDGITTYHEYDHETKVTTIYQEGDAEVHLEFSKELAKNNDYTQKGIKDGMWHYCHIPNIVLLKWANEGVDIKNPNELIRMVNRPEWGYLKTTTKRHGR